MSSDNDNQPGTSSILIVTATLSLFLLVILIIIRHLYVRFLLRRRQRRRRATPYPLNIGVALTQVQLSEPPSTGLDGAAIASLPMFRYKPADELCRDEVVECSVCLSAIVEEAKVRILPKCKHLFHVECIDMWLSSHTTCPVCRTLAEPGLQPRLSQVGTGAQPTVPAMEGSAPEDAA